MRRDGSSIDFNGANNLLENGVYCNVQPEPVVKLKQVSDVNVGLQELITQRARNAYIAAVARPDITFSFAQAVQVRKPDASAASALNPSIQLAKENQQYDLKFFPMDVASVRLAAFSDASFASNADSTSQLGYVVTLPNAFRHTNIFHYSFMKSKRVTVSVLAADCSPLYSHLTTQAH